MEVGGAESADLAPGPSGEPDVLTRVQRGPGTLRLQTEGVGDGERGGQRITERKRSSTSHLTLLFRIYVF